MFRRDLAKIQATGYSSVRTFSTVFNHVSIGPYLADFNLKANLGIMMRQGDEQMWLDINGAISAANHGRNYVSQISVGNENLSNDNLGQIVWIINHIKSRVPGHVMVGTTQRPNEWLSHDIHEIYYLANTAAYLGVNVYPFFSDLGNGAVPMIKMLNLQWDQIQRRFPHSKLILGETGWPSAWGHNNHGNEASDGISAQYYREFKEQFFNQGSAGASLGADEAYYFQFFDQPYKNGQFEPHFGLTIDGETKNNFNWA